MSCAYEFLSGLLAYRLWREISRDLPIDWKRTQSVTDRTYCLTLSHYNPPQNKALRSFLQQMDEANLTADYGSSRRSVLGSLNHLLWLDQTWLTRLFKVKPPEAPQDKTATLTPTSAAW
jgi:uncharacterized damage-inducible protein DinB